MHKVENKADPWLFYMKMCKMVAYGRYFRELHVLVAFVQYFRELHEMMAQGLLKIRELCDMLKSLLNR